MLARTSPHPSGRAAHLAAAVLAPLALVVGVLLVPTQASAATPAEEYAAQAFATTNHVRDDRDRRALKPNPCLRQAAVQQARRMASRREIFHQQLEPLLSGCDMDLVGENVAYGYRSGAAVVEDGWMESRGHRANILEQGYSRMGIAARRGEDGRWYVAQVLGRPQS